MSQVRQAIEILQKALPSMGIGTKPYESILSSLQSLNKAVPPTAENQGVQQNTLRDLGQQAQQNGVMQALMRAMGQRSGGGLPAPGGAAAAGGASPPAAVAA